MRIFTGIFMETQTNKTYFKIHDLTYLNLSLLFSSLKNGNPQNPYCAGIDGVMEAYYQSLKSVQLYGPTNFSPVINHVAR